MLNMDFEKRVVINTNLQKWHASPRAGVWRKPLAREEAERGHATSIVRYEPGASFSAHDHPLGEEILVLEGTFSDESGDYPAGTYFRNPEGFHHAPFSEEGCVILVKLHQFAAGDDQHVCVDTSKAAWNSATDNVRSLALHDFEGESVSLEHWPAGEYFKSRAHHGGEEIYVISGAVIDEAGHHPPGTWIRNPPRSSHDQHVDQATVIWIKTGHLPVQSAC